MSRRVISLPVPIKNVTHCEFNFKGLLSVIVQLLIQQEIPDYTKRNNDGKYRHRDTYVTMYVLYMHAHINTCIRTYIHTHKQIFIKTYIKNIYSLAYIPAYIFNSYKENYNMRKHKNTVLTHCGRVTQICVFNTVKLGTSASSP